MGFFTRRGGVLDGGVIEESDTHVETETKENLEAGDHERLPIL